MKATLTQPEQLAALVIKKAPYTAAKLGPGLTLLVYKQAKGTHWGMYSEHGKRKIGPAQIADGGEGMTFSEASAFAKRLFEQEQATGVAAIVDETSDLDPATMTFGQAWDLYLDWAEATKTDKGVKTIRQHHKATSDLHQMKITSTPLRVLKTWAERQLGQVGGSGKPKTSGSVGKNITQMKAVLNHVQAEYDVDLSGPWQKLKAPANALAPVKKNPQGALMGDDLEAVVTAAYRIGKEEGHLFHLMALTGLRQGDLTKATVGCFKRASGLLVLTEHKTAHKTGDLKVILSPAARKLLVGIISGRPDDAPLVGKWWTPDQLVSTVWRKVSTEAGINTSVYSMNSIRHGFATSALYAGVPILSLAKAMGTSIQMIQNHYGHVLAEMEAQAWAAHQPLAGGHLKVVS